MSLRNQSLLFCCALWATLLMVGCAEPTATNDSADATVDGDRDQTSTPATNDTSNHSTNSTPSTDPPSTTSPSTNAGNATTQTPRANTTSETPSETTAADANAEPAESIPGAESIAKLNHPQATRAFEDIRNQLAQNPEDVNAQLNLANMLQNVGHMLIQQQQPEDGYAAYEASAQIADKLLENKEQIPPNAGRLFGNIYYNAACVHGRNDETAEAMAALDKAFEWGLDDLSMLEQDADLASVRALPEYEQKKEAWQQQVVDKAKQHAQELLASGETFPFDFTLTDVNGTEQRLADHVGKVVIVDFWGTWCPPCRAEIPSFVKLQETYGPEGFQMFGLNYERAEGEEGAQLVRDFMAENNMNYPCAMGDEELQKQAGGIEGYPTTLFIDKTGTVRLKLVGMHPYVTLEAIVTTLMEEPGPEGAAPGDAAPDSTESATD